MSVETWGESVLTTSSHSASLLHHENILFLLSLLGRRPAEMKAITWTRPRPFWMPRQVTYYLFGMITPISVKTQLFCFVFLSNTCDSRRSTRPVRLDGARTRSSSSRCSAWGTETIYCEVPWLHMHFMLYTSNVALCGFLVLCVTSVYLKLA